jgi:hypothetical protein
MYFPQVSYLEETFQLVINWTTLHMPIYYQLSQSRNNLKTKYYEAERVGPWNSSL